MLNDSSVHSSLKDGHDVVARGGWKLSHSRERVSEPVSALRREESLVSPLGGFPVPATAAGARRSRAS